MTLDLLARFRSRSALVFLNKSWTKLGLKGQERTRVRPQPSRLAGLSSMAHLSRGFVGTRHVADKNNLHASFFLASPGRRFRRTPVHCAHAPWVQREDKATHKAVSELRAVAVVIVLAHAVAASEAQAWDHSWKPRRHHKRMTERSIDVKQFFQVCYSRCHTCPAL